MSNDAVILTTKDFTILEVMLERCMGREDPLAPLLRRKINAAQVVFGDDVPADVATMSSRIVFSIDGRDPDTRILSHDRMTSPVGLYLPINTLRGLALLGLSEGQRYSFERQDGEVETILLDRVLYQPETARREKELLVAPAVRGKPVLRLIRGAQYGRPEAAPITGPDYFDDPGGPSAA